MCSPVACPTCQKTTWRGCGQHVDQVKAQVRPEDWCTCSDDPTGAASGNAGLR